MSLLGNETRVIIATPETAILLRGFCTELEFIRGMESQGDFFGFKRFIPTQELIANLTVKCTESFYVERDLRDVKEEKLIEVVRSSPAPIPRRLK